MSVVMRHFGLPATVTRPHEPAITTTVAWVPPLTEEHPSGATAARRRESRKVLAVRRDQVPTVPRGTVIVAPEELDGTDETWRVDGVEHEEHDHYRLVVLKVS